MKSTIPKMTHAALSISNYKAGLEFYEDEQERLLQKLMKTIDDSNFRAQNTFTRNALHEARWMVNHYLTKLGEPTKYSDYQCGR